MTNRAPQSSVVIASYYYDAFGVILEETGSFANPFRYAGYSYDSRSKLYYLYARFYDARIARFMSEDTYHGNRVDPLSLNLYVYCRNNPLIYYDPTGHVMTQVQYNAYAEYYGIPQTGAWKDTVDQVLINEGKGSSVGSTSSPSDWASSGYAGNGKTSNISNDSYNALADQLRLDTQKSPYKDVIDTLLGVGGYDSFTNVSIHNGVVSLGYSQNVGITSYALNPTALVGLGASPIVGPQSSTKTQIPGVYESGYGYGGIFDLNEYVKHMYGNEWTLTNSKLLSLPNYTLEAFRVFDTDLNNCVPTAITRILWSLLDANGTQEFSSSIYWNVMSISKNYSPDDNYMNMKFWSIDNILSDALALYGLDGVAQNTYSSSYQAMKDEIDA